MKNILKIIVTIFLIIIDISTLFATVGLIANKYIDYLEATGKIDNGFLLIFGVVFIILVGAAIFITIGVCILTLLDRVFHFDEMEL